MSDWFLTKGAHPSAAARIFCFPYAGGGPHVYLDWQPHLAADAELVAMCPPGRGHRAREPVPTLEALIDGAAAAIATAVHADDRPVYLFGHSLGGLIAFEVARRLRDLPTLRRLIVSGIAAPALLPTPRVRELARLEGRAFAEALTFFGGLPPEVVADAEVLDLLLPGLIADFRMAVQYRYRTAEPLAVRISVITGRDDPHVKSDHVRPWRAECRHPPDYRWADGGHFYFDSRPWAAIDLLRGLVRADHHVETI